MNSRRVFKLVIEKQGSGAKTRLYKPRTKQVGYQKLPKDLAIQDKGEESTSRISASHTKKLGVMNNSLCKTSGEQRGNQKRPQPGNEVEQRFKSRTADSDKCS